MQHDNISGATRILAVIADPVAQARSPGMANTLLRERGQFGHFVLIPLHVTTGGLRNALNGLRQIRNLGGAVVSMPHKQSIVPLLDELTANARLVGSVNVVRRSADGRLLGDVLDGEGMVQGLRGAGHEVEGRACLLLGAGGAAAAIAFALGKHRCASLRIMNRTQATAAALAQRLHGAFPELDVRVGAAEEESYDIGINATPLGMQSSDPLPMSAPLVDRCALIAECVVAPELTPLLELARSRQRLVHTGIPMLSSQMELMLRFMGAPL